MSFSIKKYNYIINLKQNIKTTYPSINIPVLTANSIRLWTHDCEIICNDRCAADHPYGKETLKKTLSNSSHPDKPG